MQVQIRIVKHRYLIDHHENDNEKCLLNRYRIMKTMKVIWKIVHHWLHRMVRVAFFDVRSNDFI